MRRALLVLLTASILSCSRPPPDSTPEGALREWIDRMDTQHVDPKRESAAYALLSKSTHEKLEKRAERASRIEGHHVEPYDVLAQGRFALRFRPKHFTTNVSSSGDTASIEVTGEEPEDHATIHCVKEGPEKQERWRVSLDLPDLVDLPRRQEN